jgi:hypothetical protein
MVRAHGALIADDVHRNGGFHAYEGSGTFVCRSDDGPGFFGIVLRGRPAAEPALHG